MRLSRIRYLEEALEQEDIDLVELAEIEEEFNALPDSVLRDERENATAKDMLDELRGQVSAVEEQIYEWVVENFGESEALDPSWDIGELADYINLMVVHVGNKEVELGEML